MINFYTCPNGEIINTETGEIVDFADFEPFPPLSEDTQTLLRHFDGMSAEPLGTIPKVIVLSRAEERLLRQISPWKFFKAGVRSDYLKMIAKINDKRISIFRSVWMKNAWRDLDSAYNSPLRSARLSASLIKARADPNSTFNSFAYKQNRILMNTPEYRMKISKAMIKARADPTSKYHTPQYRANLSESIKRARADPDSVFHTAEYIEKRRQIMIKARTDPKSKFNAPGYKEKHRDAVKKASNTPEVRAKRSLAGKIRYSNPRARLRHGIAMRKSFAWKRLADVFEMLFAEEGI